MQIAKNSHFHTIMKKLSIKKGFDQVQHQHTDLVKSEIMSVLDIKSRTQWAAYLRGDVEPKMSKAMAIGEIFKKVGVTDFYEPC